MVNTFTGNVNTFTFDVSKLTYMKKELIGQRIKRLRIAAGFPSHQALALVVGCTRANVSTWEAKTSGTISGTYLNPLASALKVTPNYVLYGEDGDQVMEPIRAYAVRQYTEEGDLDAEREVLVDEVDVTLAAGDGVSVPEFVETKYQMPYQSAWFKRKHAKPEDVKLMRVHGDSMEPLVFDGDRVAVHLKDNQRVTDGKVYALIFGQDRYGRIKRLYRTKNGYRIVSDNRDKERFPDELIEGEDLEGMYLLGRVIDKSGSGGL